MFLFLRRIGVSAAAPVMAMGMMPVAGDAAAEEKSEFDVELQLLVSNQCYQGSKRVTGLGLKEARIG